MWKYTKYNNCKPLQQALQHQYKFLTTQKKKKNDVIIKFKLSHLEENQLFCQFTIYSPKICFILELQPLQSVTYFFPLPISTL